MERPQRTRTCGLSSLTVGAANEDHVGARLRDRESHLPTQAATAAGDEETFSGQFESVEDAHRGARFCCPSVGRRVPSCTQGAGGTAIELPRQAPGSARAGTACLAVSWR